MDRNQGYLHIVRTSVRPMTPSLMFPQRTLVEASEKLEWPLPVDYTAATAVDRTAFELAFHNLLKLQSAYVCFHHCTMCKYSVILEEKGYMRPPTGHGQRKTGYTLYKRSYSLSP